MSDYIPEPVPSWMDIIAAKDAEIKRLRAALEEPKMKDMTESEAADHFYDKWLTAVAKNKRLANEIVMLEARIKKLEAAMYASEREAHVEMGR